MFAACSDWQATNNRLYHYLGCLDDETERNVYTCDLDTAV